MNAFDLKSVAAKGVLWNGLDKLGVSFSQFIVGIILARMLVPSDFGIIGMLAIFISISQSFIESGLWSGLIQKKNRTEIDYSTAFIFNLAVSILIYILLFIIAPLISGFYGLPVLTKITRVLGLSIVINSIAIVQRAILNIKYDFKSLAIVNLISIIVSGIASIILAMNGYGVWALVIRQILHSMLVTIILWIFYGQSIPLIFSRQSFNQLFRYGSRILAAGIYGKILNNISNVLIGKYYTATDLGLYSQAKAISNYSANVATSVLKQVTFPILSSLQDDSERLISVHQRVLSLTAFVTFPVMLTLAVMAGPLFDSLLGEKWAGAVSLFQFLCISKMLYPLSVLNLNLINSIGRSDIFLRVELLKSPITIIALVITVPYGVEYIVAGHVVTSLIFYFMNAYMPGRLFGYGGIKQIVEIIPHMLITLMATAIGYGLSTIAETSIVKLIFGLSGSAGVYLFVNMLLKSQELIFIVDTLKSMKKKQTLKGVS